MERLEQRPWGLYVTLYANRQYKIKQLHIDPGQMISLQSHNHRNEHWIVIAGQGEVTLGGRVWNVAVDDKIYIPAGEKHRLANNSDKELLIVEVQTGDYFGEDDIVRYDDKYDRQ